MDSKGLRSWSHMAHRFNLVEPSLPISWAPPHRITADDFCETVPTKVYYRDQGTGDSKIQWFLSKTFVMQNLKEGRKSKREEKQGSGDGWSGETLRRKDKSLLILAVTSYEVSMGQPLWWLIDKGQRIHPGRCLIPREGARVATSFLLP